MANHESQNQSAQKVSVWSGIDVFMRIIAIILGVIFLAGFLRFSKVGSIPFILVLSHSALMFLCAASSIKYQRILKAATLVAALLACIDFFVRALPSLQREFYPPDIVLIYVAELIVAVWFTYTFIFRKGGENAGWFTGDVGAAVKGSWGKKRRERGRRD